MVRTRAMVQTLRVGKIARNTMAPSRKGSPKNTSVIRLMTVSVKPPNHPAAVPEETPRITVPIVVRIATLTDLPVPQTKEDHMSQPARVYPKGLSQVGVTLALTRAQAPRSLGDVWANRNGANDISRTT